VKGLKKGLKVRVISGKEKGKESQIEAINILKKTVVLKGLNIFKKTIKGNEQTGPGKIQEREMPLNWSKIKII
jgi:large subunit ribosomal protein L24